MAYMLFMTRLFQLLAILATLLVIYMSLRPSFSVEGASHSDKAMHFFAYAVLAGLTRLGWPRLWGGWIVVGFIALGIALEIGQHMMAQGRTGSILDALANSLGVIVVSLIFLFYRRRGSI